jgi:triacylglycerol lipase
VKTLLLGVFVLLWGSCHSTNPVSVSAPYSVPLSRLDGALDCGGGLPDGGGRDEPVLLVHGTSVTPAQNWGWGYRPALQSAGFEVCWVSLPNAALGDIQISAEYAARAVELMNASSGERIDVIGHSQGGVVARWAIKYFDAGAEVDDYIGFAVPEHGTLSVLSAIRANRCLAPCWQLHPGSRFLIALNEGDETPGTTSFTSIYTANDEFVYPVQTSALEGGANVLIQELCPGRPVEHLLMAGDAVTWDLTVDALTHPGSLDLARISRLTCFKLALPGATLDWPSRGADTSKAEFIESEPPVKDYALNP